MFYKSDYNNLPETYSSGKSGAHKKSNIKENHTNNLKEQFYFDVENMQKYYKMDFIIEELSKIYGKELVEKWLSI